MALTPEQLKSNLASLTPSDVKKAATKKVKPLITPSPTTPTTKVIPEITSVKPLAPKQNIMSPSLEVQA
jgi:aspartate/methionine/tyrosine aminotransferase